MHRAASGTREYKREKSHHDIRDLERNTAERRNQFLQLLLCSLILETEINGGSYVVFFDTTGTAEEEAAVKNWLHTPLPLFHFELH